MTSIATRKKLLLMESDINRAHFFEAVHDWRMSYHRTKERLSTITSIVSLAGKLVTAVPAIRNIFSNRTSQGEKARPPFLFNAAVTGTSLWLLVRSFLKRL